MNKPKPKYVLREGQTFSGFVRVNLATIESERGDGVLLEAILADIRRLTSFRATLGVFKMALYRAREHLRKYPPRPPLVLPPAPPSDAPVVTYTNRVAPPPPRAKLHTEAPRQFPSDAKGSFTLVRGVPTAMPVRKGFDFKPAPAKDELRELMGATTEEDMQ